MSTRNTISLPTFTGPLPMNEQRTLLSQLRLLVNRAKLEAGASLVEYALLVVLIAIIAFAAVQLAGDTLSGTYSNIASSLVDANAN